MDKFKPLEIGRDIAVHLERELQGKEGTTVELNGNIQKFDCKSFSGVELRVDLRFAEGEVSNPRAVCVDIVLTSKQVVAHIAEALAENGFDLKNFRVESDQALREFAVTERLDGEDTYMVTFKNEKGTGSTFSGPNAIRGFPSARPLLVVVRDFLQSGGATEKLK